MAHLPATTTQPTRSPSVVKEHQGLDSPYQPERPAPDMTAAVRKLNRRMSDYCVAAGVSRGVRVQSDGSMKWPEGHTIPREVRALGTEMLVTLGLPAMVEALIDPEATHTEKVAVVRVLKDLSIGDAKSLARDGDGEDVPGIALLPPLDARPVPPGDGEEVELPPEDEEPVAVDTQTASQKIAAKLKSHNASRKRG